MAHLKPCRLQVVDFPSRVVTPSWLLGIQSTSPLHSARHAAAVDRFHEMLSFWCIQYNHSFFRLNGRRTLRITNHRVSVSYRLWLNSVKTFGRDLNISPSHFLHVFLPYLFHLSSCTSIWQIPDIGSENFVFKAFENFVTFFLNFKRML